MIEKMILIISIIFMVGCTTTGNVIVESTDSAICTDDCADSGIVKIPVSDVKGSLNKYTHYANGVEVNYFTIKGTDGEVRTALDACDVCGGALGYSLVGDDVVCNNCGRHFHIDDLGTKNTGGGCWPGLLPHEIENGNIVISTDDLDRAAVMFN